MDQNYKVEKPNSLISSFNTEMNFHQPAEALNSYIFPYIFGKISHKNILDVATRPIPTGYIGMYIHSAAPIKIYDYKFQNPTIHSAFVTGVYTLNKLTFLCATGQVENVVVTFKPGGFYAMFKRNASEIKNKVVDLKQLIGNEEYILTREFRNAKTLSEKIEILDHFFQNRLNIKASNQIDEIRIENLLNYIQKSNGCVTLTQICEEFSVISRNVERYFARLIGVSPKEYIDIIRFNYLLNYLMERNFVNWQEIIYSLGFYDQSHFIKSFKSVTGYTPIEFIKDHEHRAILLDRFQIIRMVKDLILKS